MCIIIYFLPISSHKMCEADNQVLNGLTVLERDVLSLSQPFRKVVPPLMSTNVSFLFPCVR